MSGSLVGRLKFILAWRNNFHPAHKAHPAFSVDDVLATAATMTATSCVITEDELLAGYDRVFVCDPFGNYIELMQSLATD